MDWHFKISGDIQLMIRILKWTNKRQNVFQTKTQEFDGLSIFTTNSTTGEIILHYVNNSTIY